MTTRYVSINLGVGGRSGYVMVQPDYNGTCIKAEAIRALKMQGRAEDWQLLALMPNGSARVVGDDEVPPQPDFHMIEVADNA